MRTLSTGEAATGFTNLRASNIIEADVEIRAPKIGKNTISLNNGVIRPSMDPTATVVAKTSNYTVTAADFGKIITNTGASGALTHTLPAASTVTGKIIRFATLAAQIVNLSPAAADGVFLNGSGVDDKDLVMPGTIGTAVTLYSNGVNYEAYDVSGLCTKEA